MSTLNFAAVSVASRDAVDAALRSMGKHDLADLLPPAGRYVLAEIVSLIDEAATAFEDGRPLDGVTAVERALQPKWESEAQSKQEWTAADWQSQPLAGVLA